MNTASTGSQDTSCPLDSGMTSFMLSAINAVVISSLVECVIGKGMNTEICEQVNAFLQCIKFTASHLSQEHFAFFLQFFLYLLNKEKTAKHNKLCTVVVAGHL